MNLTQGICALELTSFHLFCLITLLYLDVALDITWDIRSPKGKGIPATYAFAVTRELGCLVKKVKTIRTEAVANADGFVAAKRYV